MKFIHYLETITGVGIYPLLSLLVFVAFFIAVTWYAFRADRESIDKASRIPLDSGAETDNQNLLR